MSSKFNTISHETDNLYPYLNMQSNQFDVSQESKFYQSRDNTIDESQYQVMDTTLDS